MGDLLELRAYCQRRWDDLAEAAAETEGTGCGLKQAERHDHLEQVIEFLEAPMS
jgi:hypothetical protein